MLSFVRAIGLLGFCLSFSACDQVPDRVEILDEHEISRHRPIPEKGLSEAKRLGVAETKAPATGGGESDAPQQIPFTWTAPEGWREGPTSQMRMIHYRFGPEGENEGECYVTFLPGAAGGIRANLDRWRTQMGKEPFTQEELLELPLKPFLQGEAFFIDVSGAYTGFNAAPKPDQRLLGIIQEQAGLTGFVKLTGPADLVAKEVENFHSFCQSIKFRRRSEAAE